jgi:hypothetical protein
LDQRPGYDARLRAALPLAAAGFIEEAEAIATELVSMNPRHTIINSILVPIVRAGIAMAREQHEHAIEILQIVSPYELGFIAALAPVYLRGQSYLVLGSGVQAAPEFQRVFDHRGSDPFSPFYAAAQVGNARAHAMNGDLAASQEAYARFLEEWNTADSDVPLLLEAREERLC